MTRSRNLITESTADMHALSGLVAVDNEFSVAAKKEFYCYNAGKWKRCSQGAADRMIADDVQAPLHFHSVTCPVYSQQNAEFLRAGVILQDWCG